MTPEGAARVALVNLGCRLNRVETDLIASDLERAGCSIADKGDADAIVVNTCAVTGEAQTKTRKAVRSATRVPGVSVVVATGCVASLFADELLSISPKVVVEPHKGKVCACVLDRLGISGREAVESDVLGLASSPTPTGRTRPGIKIQDGCGNRCTYCIVWKARGASRSLSSARIVDAVREACARGAREVVLTGVNLGSYRTGDQDALGVGKRLPELLTHLLDVTPIERVRLSSIEPPDVTDELLDVMAASQGRVAPFLHICLQSGCDATLARMGRVYDTALYARVVAHARARMPRIALGTDLIVGFPGETDEDFQKSFAFCEKMAFARMHVFRYSKRPGTPAAEYEGQVSARVMAQRSERVRSLARRMRATQIKKAVGTCDRVLVQSAGRAVSSALFDVLVDDSLPTGTMVDVRFEDVRDGVLVGEAV